MQPTTGWYSGNDLDWDGMGFPVACDCQPDENDEYPEECYCDLHYYGDFIEGDDGMLEPDPDGQWAAVYNSNTNDLAVIWSKTLRVGQLGSPCIPGQVSADMDDEEYDGDDNSLVPAHVGMMHGTQFAGPTARTVYYGLPDECIYHEGR